MLSPQEVDLSDDEELSRAIAMSFQSDTDSDLYDEDKDDLESSIDLDGVFQSCLRETLEGSTIYTEDSQDVEFIQGISEMLMSRFEKTAKLDDVDNSILLLNCSIDRVPDSHSSRPFHLYLLGRAHTLRFHVLNDVDDIDNAVHYLQQTVDCATHKDDDVKHAYLYDLGLALNARYDLRASPTDLDQSISVLTQAVSLIPMPSGSRKMFLAHGHLGAAYRHRFDLKGQTSDLNQGLLVLQQAVDNSVLDKAEKRYSFSHLGSLLIYRFNRAGAVTDLDRGISCLSTAADLVPTENNDEKSIALHNLANALRSRGHKLHDIADIDRSIAMMKQTIDLTQTNSTDRPFQLRELGELLRNRFERTLNRQDIDDAVNCLEEGFRTARRLGLDYYSIASVLGVALGTRYESFSDDQDLEKSIFCHRKVLSLLPPNVNKSRYLDYLAYTLMANFGRYKNIADVEEAISMFQQVVDLEQEYQNTHWFVALSTLAAALYHHYMSSGNRDYLARARDVHRQVAQIQTGGPALRHLNASLWAECSLDLGEPSQALDACSLALELIPRVAWVGGTVTRRYKDLKEDGSRPTGPRAAQIAIAAGQPMLALEFLEQSRSVVWRQMLNLRTPMDDLHQAAPDLADKLTRVSINLEKASVDTDSPNSTPLFRLDDDQEQTGQMRRQLADEWETLLQEARGVDGFEDFLRPKKFAELSKAAQHGPVVLVNVSQGRAGEDSCDALILVDGLDEVVHVPLPDFSLEKARKLQDMMRKSLHASGVRARLSLGKPRREQGKEDQFPYILSVLWTDIVKPILDGLGFSVSTEENPPRMFWCLTGPLTFLPIHAAGIYGHEEKGSRIFDYVTSSYIPTVSTLLGKPPTASEDFCGLLAVSQPATPGYDALPGTVEEMKVFTKYSGDHVFRHLDGPAATVKSVVNGMEKYSWVHLACHGVQHLIEPTKSAFCLQDGKLELAEIIKNNFPHADFAFLSACQTALGDETLSEEAVHLASGFLLAGYRSVIATMWSIHDQDAPLLVDKVYLHLLGNNTSPDSTRTAHALYHAVSGLREERGEQSFLSWVPFIHLGL